jgi:NADP-dependent aldehyde dehydrogenase
VVSAETILITGAAGRIGRVLRPGLARENRTLRLLDIAPLDPAGPGEDVELLDASFTDPESIAAACRSVDAVIHLGGLAGESSWADIAAVNIEGTLSVLEAACAANVPRVVLASSIHAAGFHTRDELGDGEQLPAEIPPRPDTFYGVGKAAMEALGSLYHSRFGVDVVCLRIGAFRPMPLVPADLAAWLSPGDAVRLFEACLLTRPPGYRVVWGISANTRRWWSAAEAAEIGYRAEDDAEYRAAEILGGESFDPADPLNARVGGTFCTMHLGKGLTR